MEHNILRQPGRAESSILTIREKLGLYARSLGSNPEGAIPVIGDGKPPVDARKPPTFEDRKPLRRRRV